MTIAEIKTLRSQLPENWQWSKCYELHDSEHWALTTMEAKNFVESAGLISIDFTSTKKEFFKHDIPVQFVEKSLEIVDFLLAEIKRLKNE